MFHIRPCQAPQSAREVKPANFAELFILNAVFVIRSAPSFGCPRASKGASASHLSVREFSVNALTTLANSSAPTWMSFRGMFMWHFHYFSPGHQQRLLSSKRSSADTSFVLGGVERHEDCHHACTHRVFQIKTMLTRSDCCSVSSRIAAPQLRSSYQCTNMIFSC